METKAEDLVLWQNDPLLYIFKERLHFSGLLITLSLTAVAAIVELGLSWIADRSYTGSGVRLSDPQALYFALAYTFIFTPLVIGFYVWQCGAFTNVLRGFEQTDVIQEVSDKGRPHVKSYPDFLAKFQSAVDKRRWWIIAVVLALGFWANELLVAWPSEFSASGRSAFWYDVKWLLVIRVLNFSIWLYALWMIVLREVPAILYFNRLFQWFDVRIHPMHPDEAGGLGALGDFTLKTSLIAVGLGVIAVMFSAQIWLTGDNPFTRSDVLALWVLYIVVAPLSLTLPMLSAHRAMQEARSEKLKEVAQEFETTLSEHNVAKTNDVEALKQANEKLKELQARYGIVAASFPTWPVPARLFRNFSITASLPMMSGLISMVINFATNK